MRLKTSLSLLFALACALLLAGCVTGLPGTGYPGSGYPSGGYPSSRSQQVEGEVLDTDHGNGRFMLADGRGYGGQRAEVYYDQRTRLVYQGRELSPQGLERGDVVRVHGEQWSGRFQASHIEVLRDVRQGGYGQQPPYGGVGQLNVLEGSLRHIDTRTRTLSVTRGGYSGPQQQVRFDERTRVEDRGRFVRVDQLRAGDVLRIEMRQVAGGWIAERIQVQSGYNNRW
ncbi:MAG: DUF5666 domain-containing protein [Pseudoxanthomonas suwonensis]|nr:DUF5666 domain-containing protein [Pseudoxanthomonas suwonensis]